MTPEALAALCAAAMPEERLTAEELAYLCFGETDEVFGDERGAAVLQTKHFGEHLVAWLILVAVDPGAQRRGLGTELVHAVAERARELGAAAAAARERGAALHLARGRPREHARRNAARSVRVRTRVDRHQHDDPVVVPPPATCGSTCRTRDRRRCGRVREPRVPRVGTGARTGGRSGYGVSRRARPTVRRSASDATR